MQQNWKKITKINKKVLQKKNNSSIIQNTDKKREKTFTHLLSKSVSQRKMFIHKENKKILESDHSSIFVCRTYLNKDKIK